MINKGILVAMYYNLLDNSNRYDIKNGIHLRRALNRFNNRKFAFINLQLLQKAMQEYTILFKDELDNFLLNTKN